MQRKSEQEQQNLEAFTFPDFPFLLHFSCAIHQHRYSGYISLRVEKFCVCVFAIGFGLGAPKHVETFAFTFMYSTMTHKNT